MLPCRKRTASGKCRVVRKRNQEASGSSLGEPLAVPLPGLTAVISEFHAYESVLLSRPSALPSPSQEMLEPSRRTSEVIKGKDGPAMNGLLGNVAAFHSFPTRRKF